MFATLNSEVLRKRCTSFLLFQYFAFPFPVNGNDYYLPFSTYELKLIVWCSFMSSFLRTIFCPSTPTTLFSADNQVLFGALLGSLLQSYRDSLFTVVLALSP